MQVPLRQETCCRRRAALRAAASLLHPAVRRGWCCRLVWTCCRFRSASTTKDKAWECSHMPWSSAESSSGRTPLNSARPSPVAIFRGSPGPNVPMQTSWRLGGSDAPMKPEAPTYGRSSSPHTAFDAAKVCCCRMSGRVRSHGRAFKAANLGKVCQEVRSVSNGKRIMKVGERKHTGIPPGTATRSSLRQRRYSQ